MMILNHGFRATLLLLLTLFFADRAWAATSAYYQTCIGKGYQKICATEMGDSLANAYFGGASVEATATTQADLAASGWTISEALLGLEEKFVTYVGEELLTELSLDPSNNVPVNWEHSVATDATHPVRARSGPCPLPPTEED
jgi:hypothetical protein